VASAVKVPQARAVHSTIAGISSGREVIPYHDDVMERDTRSSCCHGDFVAASDDRPRR
jgi:hypothetical protein